ncbi:hypothetical protein AKO1_005769 [Acrasis kona]|uniref:RING-type domain-containing protein n=1 Tax=Acrasis kona TaxID=1008807 RepID=A0AAW2YK40_9EUKA
MNNKRCPSCESTTNSFEDCSNCDLEYGKCCIIRCGVCVNSFCQSCVDRYQQELEDDAEEADDWICKTCLEDYTTSDWDTSSEEEDIDVVEDDPEWKMCDVCKQMLPLGFNPVCDSCFRSGPFRARLFEKTKIQTLSDCDVYHSTF